MVLTSEVINGIDTIRIVNTLFSMLQPTEVYSLLTNSNKKHRNTWIFAYFHEIPQKHIGQKEVDALYNFLLEDSDRDIQSLSYRDICFLDKYFSVDNDVILNASKIILRKKEYSPDIVGLYFQHQFNEHYIQNLSWETAKGKHQAAKEGYFIGSKVPFGYRKWKIGDSPESDRRILIRDEKEADALQKCFEMYASGNYSFEDLASFLNDQGFVSRSGQPFREDTLRGMLENPIYIGYVEYQGVKKDTYLTYIGKHVPLVSVELFNKVAAVREIRAEGKSRTKYDADVLKSHYMVQNLLCCESCRRRVRVRTADGKYTYRDYSEERGLVCKDSGKKISATYLDKLISDFIASIVLPRNWIDSVGAHANESDTVNEIKKQISDTYFFHSFSSLKVKRLFRIIKEDFFVTVGNAFPTVILFNSFAGFPAHFFYFL